MKDKGFLLAPNQFRKKQLSEKWLKFCKNFSKNPFIIQQKLKIYTLNAFFNHFDKTGSQIISLPAQELLMRKAISSLNEIPEKWRAVYSLPSIFRKAYSIKEFEYSTVDHQFEQKHYGLIRNRYLELLHNLNMVDAEQNLLASLKDFDHRGDKKIFVEYFPSATTRINYLYRFLNGLSSTFIVPEFLPEDEIGQCQNLDQFEEKVTHYISNYPLIINRPFRIFNSNIDEVSSQLNFHIDNPDTTFIMADSANYRSLYEQLSLLHFKEPAENRQTLVNSIYFELLTTIINCLTDPGAFGNWSALFSPRFNILEISEEGEILLKRYFDKLKSTGYIKNFNPNSDFPFYKKPLAFDNLFQLSESEILNPILESLTHTMSDLIILRKNYKEPQKQLEKIFEFIQPLNIHTPNHLLNRQKIEILQIIKTLQHLYSNLNVKSLTYQQFQNDFKSFCGAAKFDYFPYFPGFHLLALEDCKNISAYGDIWISGFSMESYPPRGGTQNFWLSGKQREYINRLRQVEQKAALMFLLSKYPDRIRISCSTIVNGMPSQPSLSLEKSSEILNAEKTGFPFNKGTYFAASEQSQKKIQHKITRFSASALNSFLKCPKQYFWRYIAAIPEPKELETDISKTDIGSILHRILSLFFNDKMVFKAIKQIADPAEVFERLKPSLSAFVLKAGSEFPAKLLLQDHLNQDYLAQWTRYTDNYSGFLFAFLKNHIDYLFKKQQDQTQIKIRQIETEIKFTVTDENLNYVGKIDRFDLYSGNGLAEIWEYKSGNISNLIKEERELTNIQRPFYSFLLRKSDQYPVTNVITHFQPISGAKMDPTPDYKIAFIEKLNKIKKSEVVDDKLIPQLNELYYRINEPGQIIVSRLNNDNLPIHKKFQPFEETIHRLDIDEKNKMCDSLLSDLQEMDSVNDQFIPWLAKQSNQGPYPAIPGRICDYCSFISMCDAFSTEKPDSEEYSNE